MGASSSTENSRKPATQNSYGYQYPPSTPAYTTRQPSHNAASSSTTSTTSRQTPYGASTSTTSTTRQTSYGASTSTTSTTRQTTYGVSSATSASARQPCINVYLGTSASATTTARQPAYGTSTASTSNVHRTPVQPPSRPKPPAPSAPIQPMQRQARPAPSAPPNPFLGHDYDYDDIALFGGAIGIMAATGTQPIHRQPAAATRPVLPSALKKTSGQNEKASTSASTPTFPIAPGASEVVIIGDCVIRDIRRYLPKEYKVFWYANATIKDVTAKVKEVTVAGHVQQIVLHVGTFDLNEEMKIRRDDFLAADEKFSTEFRKIIENMRKLISYTHEKFPSATIFISAVLQRKSISSEIFDEINGELRDFARKISNDLRGILKIKFIDGGVNIDPWRRIRDGIHLPPEVSEIFAENLKAVLIHYRPLKGVAIEQKFEPEIRVGNAKTIVISDCVLKDLRRYLPDEYRVFWYKNGTIAKLKEKLIATQPAYKAEKIILHVGMFDTKAFEASFETMMDETIELILIALDRFPKATVYLSQLPRRADDQAMYMKVMCINDFYQQLGTVLSANRFSYYNFIRSFDAQQLEPDGIHLKEDQTRCFAEAVTAL